MNKYLLITGWFKEARRKKLDTGLGGEPCVFLDAKEQEESSRRRICHQPASLDGLRKRCTATASSVRRKGARPLPPFRRPVCAIPAHDGACAGRTARTKGQTYQALELYEIFMNVESVFGGLYSAGVVFVDMCFTIAWASERP